MNTFKTMRQPSLIVVTGRPGSGKTTLAHTLALAVRCPALCRDEIKEGLIQTIGMTPESSDDIARRTYEIFFETLALLLNQGVTVIAEAAFQHKLWEPKLKPLQSIARIRIIICRLDVRTASIRRIERGIRDPDRERFHLDKVSEAFREKRELPLDDYDPPHLEVPTLTVDTSQSQQPDLKSIVSFALG